MTPADLLVELYLLRSKCVSIVWGSIFPNSWFWHLQVRWCQWEIIDANVMFIASTCLVVWALHIRNLLCAFTHSFINAEQCFNEIVTDPHLDYTTILYHLSFYLNALYLYLPFQSKWMETTRSTFTVFGVQPLCAFRDNYFCMAPMYLTWAILLMINRNSNYNSLINGLSASQQEQ